MAQFNRRASNGPLHSSSSAKDRRRKDKDGGSEPVTAEPNRPKLGEGGAAAAPEYDD